MLEIFNYSFMIRAFVAGSIIAVVTPLIGSFLVVKKLSLISDTLAHISLSGVALGLLLGVNPLLATVLFTTLMAVIIEKIRENKLIPADTLLAMFLPGGLALSVVLISIAKGFNSNLFSYLFGSITTVQPDDLILILSLGISSVVIVFILYKKLFYTSFDEEGAKVSGINVGFINLTLVILTAVVVSLSMRVVGILLVGALMVIPVASSMQVAKSFTQSLFVSVLFALTSVLLGLFAAFYFNLPAGGSIVLISLIIFSLVSVIKKR